MYVARVRVMQPVTGSYRGIVRRGEWELNLSRTIHTKLNGNSRVRIGREMQRAPLPAGCIKSASSELSRRRLFDHAQRPGGQFRAAVLADGCLKVTGEPCSSASCTRSSRIVRR
jgi:hypothetical protein